MRSRSARVRGTSPSWSTTTPAGWCGRHPAGTARRSRSSWICSAKTAAQQIKLVSCDDADWITRPGRRALPERGHLPGPVPHRQGRDRRAGRDPPRGLERSPPRRQTSSSPSELKGARFALWKNPEQPDRAPAAQARADPEAQPPAVPRLPALPAAAPDLPRPRRATRSRCSTAWLKWARRCRLEPFVKLARRSPNSAHRVEAAITNKLSNARGRASQHPDPPDHPPRIRLPLTKGRHRPRDALTRRPLPTPTRPVTPPTDPSVGS